MLESDARGFGGHFTHVPLTFYCADIRRNDKLQDSLRTPFNALWLALGVAKIALDRAADCRIEVNATERAGDDAGLAADAFLKVDQLGFGRIVDIDCIHRTGIHAVGNFALQAHKRRHKTVSRVLHHSDSRVLTRIKPTVAIIVSPGTGSLANAAAPAVVGADKDHFLQFLSFPD